MLPCFWSTTEGHPNHPKQIAKRVDNMLLRPYRPPFFDRTDCYDEILEDNDSLSFHLGKLTKADILKKETIVDHTYLMVHMLAKMHFLHTPLGFINPHIQKFLWSLSPKTICSKTLMPKAYRKFLRDFVDIEGDAAMHRYHRAVAREEGFCNDDGADDEEEEDEETEDSEYLSEDFNYRRIGFLRRLVKRHYPHDHLSSMDEDVFMDHFTR